MKISLSERKKEREDSLSTKIIPHNITIMGCTFSVKVVPAEIKDFVRRHSPSLRSPVVMRSPMRRERERQTSERRRRKREEQQRISESSPSASPPPSVALLRGTMMTHRPSRRFESHFSTEKVAIIIGIDRYADRAWEPLDTAEADARKVAEFLAGRGFESTLLLGKEATKSRIEKALQEVRMCQSIVFYFAGHGVAGGANGPALIPFDGSFNVHATHDKVTQDFLHGWSRRTPAHGALLLLDCCYGGDFCVKLRSGERPSLCLNQKEKSRIVISASLKGERVPDSDSSGQHSPFTGAILQSAIDADFSGSAIELFVSARARCSARALPIVPKIGRLPADEGGDVFL